MLNEILGIVWEIFWVGGAGWGSVEVGALFDNALS